MTDVELPDMARLVVGFLLNRSAVTDIVDTRIYTIVPNNPTYPLVRVDELPGAMKRGPYWLFSTIIQVNVWDGTEYAAKRLARACHAAMGQSMVGVVDVTVGGTREVGVVTSVDLGGLKPDPDTSLTPVRHKARFDATVTAHPQPVTGS